jgi:septal ring factor EnvC (AmiA/AmiB activator)
MRRPAAALAAALVILAPHLDGAASDTRSAIKELGLKVKAIEEQKKKEHTRLEEIDRSMARTGQKILEARRRSEELARKIEDHKTRIAAYETILREAQQSLRRKWVALYKGAYLDMADLVAAHPEYAGYVDAVILRDMMEMERYRRAKQGLVEQRNNLDRVSKEHEAVLRDLDRTIGELRSEHTEKARLLASLDRRKKDYEGRIQALMKKLQERPTALPNRGMSKRLGSLPWPVQGTVVRGFGITRDQGFAQISNGVDIEAQEGTPVKSVYSGRIVYYDALPKFGNTMIIDHGGGLYTVYGHLARALKSNGESVSAQEAVALVGSSGDVRRPTLHFEIRYKDKPQDPVQWLSRKQ